MNNLVFELDNLSTQALEQIATLKAVDAALRDSHEKVDSISFLLPINSLDRTIHKINEVVEALFVAARNEVSA